MSATKQLDLNDEVVFDYWQKKAAEGGEDRSVTIRDHCYHDLEIDAIKDFLRPSDRLLDIGCGNGLATAGYATCVKEAVGVDYAPQMVEAANSRLQRESESIRKKLHFEVCDSRELRFPDESFSRVVMQRCLINIPDRRPQIEATLEAGRVLRRGELLLLAEVTLQGHERVNAYRTRFGLSRLMVHWHNTYLDETTFLPAMSDAFEVDQVIRFGMYGFLSKVVHPLLVAPAEPSFDAPINEVAARLAREIPDFDGCSHQVLFVLRKR